MVTRQYGWRKMGFSVAPAAFTKIEQICAEETAKMGKGKYKWSEFLRDAVAAYLDRTETKEPVDRI